MSKTEQQSAERDADKQFDAIVVGAGFAGMYLLHRLRGMGLPARVFEAGHGVGGTWYWNRYPGARCDAESLAYSFSFSRRTGAGVELVRALRAATGNPALRRSCRRKFDLRRDIGFEPA